MTDLVLRPHTIVEGKTTKWCLQMRRAGMPETEYVTLATGDQQWAREIVNAGAPFWLFGDPIKPDGHGENGNYGYPPAADYSP